MPTDITRHAVLSKSIRAGVHGKALGISLTHGIFSSVGTRTKVGSEAGLRRLFTSPNLPHDLILAQGPTESFYLCFFSKSVIKLGTTDLQDTDAWSIQRELVLIVVPVISSELFTY